MRFSKYNTCKQIKLYRFCRCYNSGFTLIEIVAVILVMSVISSVVVSRFYFSDSNLEAQTEAIKVYLRYAQVRSMNTESVWGIHCDGTNLWLYKDGDSTTNRVRLPGEDSNTVDLPEKGVSLQMGVDATFTVSFNNWGKPCIDDAAETEQDADRNLTVTSGSKSSNITITKNTGFIP
ncbi:MAG: prepilin-type N-terminal cleavage/methylation domain-containing protein [Deltaproteobacteria bacterium]|nr:prepilin-type N-terminal cleavage/methylation domain-containing protein [Deltaproteobacteria bacterium]